jgi:2-polyprenyl-6-methoxyphenol hydroxylase-like FAD-dependent oxidoreductase
MQWDVIVAGGGPSGLTLAAELAGSGARTLVLERRQGGVQSRAGTVLPRLLELFDARGIAERFIERTREIAAYPFRPTHIWAGFTPIEWRHLETRFGFTLGLPQNHTEDILRQWAGDSGAEIRHGTALQAFREDGDGVRVEALDASGESHTLRARYLIGADGGRSTVRERGGFAFEGHAGTFRGLAVDAELEAPWPGGRTGADNEMGWVRGYAFGEGITRFNIVHRDRRHAAKDEPVTLEEAKQCLRDVLGSDYGIEGFRWASRFDDQMRAVPRLRQGRVFLVGESARIHYPASGVGMNFCLQDAFNLGWKLANVVTGVADEATLDSYDAERRPAGHWFVSAATALFRPWLLKLDYTAVLDDSAEGEATRAEVGRTLKEVMLPEWDIAGTAMGYFYEDSPICVPDGSPPPQRDPMHYVQTARPGSRAPRSRRSAWGSRSRSARRSSRGPRGRRRSSMPRWPRAVIPLMMWSTPVR